MDQELREYLETLTGQVVSLGERMSSLETGMSSIDTRMSSLETRMATRDDLASLESRMMEQIEKTETRLLTAFHQSARPMEIRVRNVAATATGADERLALLEERISQLERRLPLSRN